MFRIQCVGVCSWQRCGKVSRDHIFSIKSSWSDWSAVIGETVDVAVEMGGSFVDIPEMYDLALLLEDDGAWTQSFGSVDASLVGTRELYYGEPTALKLPVLRTPLELIKTGRKLQPLMLR